MPRRHVREVPRWRRGKPRSTTLSRSSRSAGATPRRTQCSARSTSVAGQAGSAVNAAAPGNDVLAATGAWRGRRGQPPVKWGWGVWARGAGLSLTPHPLPAGVLAGLATGALLVLFTRHAAAFARRWSDAAALATAGWVPALATAGFHPPVPALLALTWAPFALAWARHYRIRPAGGSA